MPDRLQLMVATLLVDLGNWAPFLWVTLGVAGITLLVLQTFFTPDPRNPFRPAPSPKKPILILRAPIFAATAFILIITLRFPGLSRLILNPDEFGLIAGAQTLAIDPRYWVSVDNTTLGPLATFSVMLPSLFLGTALMSSMKLLGSAVWCIAVAFVFRGLARLHGDFLARVGVLPLVACVAGFTYWDYVAFNGEHMAALFIAMAIYFYARFSVDPSRLAFAIMLGTVLGLVPYAKIQATPIALLLGGAALVPLVARRQLRRAGLLVLGAFGPSVLLALYLLSADAFDHFWQSYIANNFLYAQEGFFSSTKEIPYKERVLSLPGFLKRVPDTKGFFFTQLFLTLVCAAYFGGRLLPLIRGLRYSLVSLLVLLASLLCVIVPGNNFTHYLLLVLVPMTFFTGNFLAATVGSKQIALPLGLSRAAYAMLILLGAIPLLVTLSRGNVAMENASFNLKAGMSPGLVAKEILSSAARGDRMAMWGFGLNLYVETGLAQGTKEAHTERQLNPTVQQSYYLNRYAEDLRRFQPKFFVEVFRKKKDEQGRYLHEMYRFENYPEVAQVVRKRYRLIGEFEEGCQACEATPALPGDYVARIRLFVAKDDAPEDPRRAHSAGVDLRSN